MYIKENLNALPAEELNSNDCESLWLKIYRNKYDFIIIGVCYKSPTAGLEEITKMSDQIRKASSYQSVIMGDFNYPGINWETGETLTATEGQFFELINDCFLIQHVTEPTRDKNVLDLVFTTEKGMFENLEIKDPIGKSDHNTLVWELVTQTVIPQNNVMSFSYHRGNYQGMRESINSINWSELFDEKDVKECWGIFRDRLLSEIEKFVPKSTRAKRQKNRWINRKTKKLLRKKYHYWKKFSLSGEYVDFLQYKNIRNRAVKAVRAAKRKFERKLAKTAKANPKSFYAYVRSRCKTKDKVGPIKDAKGNVVNEDKLAAEILNAYFASVFTEEDSSSLQELEARVKSNLSVHQQSELVEITSKKVLDKLNKLQINKSSGGEGLPSRVLRELSNEICVPLANLMQRSLIEGFVPDDWKIADVTPIFKKGKKSDPANYRPVSLTSQIGKVMESILKDDMLDHIRKYNLITDTQHGFVSRRSCLTNLLVFLEEVTKYIDNGHPVDAIYLDFQKAFDKVPHKRLLLKVRDMGFSVNVCNWIENWLVERKQRVRLNGWYSNWENVKSGVPQGSILGPLLFVIFINDLEKGVLSRLLKFADDTKLLGIVGTPEEVEVLRNDLKLLVNWSKDWQMLFNVAKCKVIHFGSRNAEADYSMEGSNLESITEERDLGILIHNSLKVEKQCMKAANAANQMLGMIKRSFTFHEKDVILSLYKTLVRPKLEYCIQAWRPHFKKDINLLENVQRRATRLVHSIRDLPYERRLEILGLTTLETRRLRGDLIEVFKIFKGYDDLDPSFFFVKANTVCRGHSLKLHKFRSNLDIRKFSFSQRIVNEWNLLTEHIVLSPSLNVFKAKLDVHLRENRGYT